MGRFVLNTYKKQCNIVFSGKEVKSYFIRSKNRLYSGLRVNCKHKNLYKTNTTIYIREILLSEKCREEKALGVVLEEITGINIVVREIPLNL